jgi:hypothetical protein
MPTILKRSLSISLLLVAAFASSVAHAQQLYKCEVAGRVEYRQQPCDNSAKSETVRVRTAPAPNPATRPAATASSTGAPTSPPQNAPLPSQPAAPAAQPPAQQAKSPIEYMADACLDWYRPHLRDPRGAYHREPTLDKGVLTITIYATNGHGGYVQDTGRCEFKSGRIDDGWTKIHAKRLNWPTN